MEKKFVIVHGVYRLSTDRRDIPVPPNGAAGLENPAYRAFVVPVNGYKISNSDLQNGIGERDRWHNRDDGI